jgi:HprK-related kinase B
MSGTAAQYATQLMHGHALRQESVCIGLGGWSLRIRSNSTVLLERLADYFSHVAVAGTAPGAEVVAIECASPRLDLDFADWRREAGKQGRKDSYIDLKGGRLIRKVRTGMVFVQGPDVGVAAGECLRNDNQVINFVNAQYMNHLQQDGWVICHAAGLVRNGQAIGLAGMSGGGKSTLMLHLLDDWQNRYLTNDRLFIRLLDGVVQATGIPKLPRVNPGTILHDPSLAPLIDDAERAGFAALSPDQLWDLEQKYDVPVQRLFGHAPVVAPQPLAAFVILNWRRGESAPVTLQRVDPASRPDLLGALMKSPGPFYQDSAGVFQRDDVPLDPARYLQVMRDTPTYEVCGGVDFAALIEPINRLTGHDNA